MHIVKRTLTAAMTVSLTLSSTGCFGTEDSPTGTSTTPKDNTDLQAECITEEEFISERVQQSKSEAYPDSIGIDALIWPLSKDQADVFTTQAAACEGTVAASELMFSTHDSYSAMLTPSSECSTSVLNKIPYDTTWFYGANPAVLWLQRGEIGTEYLFNGDEKRDFYFQQNELGFVDLIHSADADSTPYLLMTHYEFNYNPYTQQYADLQFSSGQNLFLYVDGVLIQETLMESRITWGLDAINTKYFGGTWEEFSNHKVHLFYLYDGKSAPLLKFEMEPSEHGYPMPLCD